MWRKVARSVNIRGPPASFLSPRISSRIILPSHQMSVINITPIRRSLDILYGFTAREVPAACKAVEAVRSLLTVVGEHQPLSGFHHSADLGLVFSTLVASREEDRHTIILHTLWAIGFKTIRPDACRDVPTQEEGILDRLVSELVTTTAELTQIPVVLHHLYKAYVSEDPLVRRLLLKTTVEPATTLLACLSAFDVQNGADDLAMLEAARVAFPRALGDDDLINLVMERVPQPAVVLVDRVLRGDPLTPKEKLSVAAAIVARVHAASIHGVNAAIEGVRSGGVPPADSVTTCDQVRMPTLRSAPLVQLLIQPYI
jgi:hypothetical protein